MAPHDGNADQTAAAAAVFQSSESFGNYQKMTAADYLEHSLLFGTVEAFLKQQAATAAKRLRLLDLGCGDGEKLARILGASPELAASYTGVDMSEAALGQAEAAVRGALGPAFPATFHHADMLSLLRQTRGAFDVVLAAFALHHLTSDDKAQALREIRRLVAPAGGCFLMVDPLRREGEDLAAYRQRATEVGETWTHMGREQQDRFIKHMQDYDIVESRAFFEQAAAAAGFSGLEVICTGQKGLQSSVTVFKARHSGS